MKAKDNMEATANESRRVVIVGASDKPDRYAWKAQKMLVEHGFKVLPVHPRLSEIEGLVVVSDVARIEGEVDTVTLYVNASIGITLADALIRLHPARVIFNPGSECPELAESLRTAGIEALEACTLVLLKTEQF
ncbi:MAG: putative CoA-binding protein [Verrucomicrobiales bacterium]|jgi:predicted CoA-binding protein